MNTGNRFRPRRRDPIAGQSKAYDRDPQRFFNILSPKVPAGDRADQASFHERNRLVGVHELLFHLHQMAVREYILPTSIVRIGDINLRGARVQWGQSTGVNQAAHWVPGQIFIRGKEPGDLVRQGAANQGEINNKIHHNIARYIDLLFGLTDDLHMNFNYADTTAENNGVRMAFLQACQLVIRNGVGQQNIRASVIDNAYDLYRQGADRAYDNAQEWLQFVIDRPEPQLTKNQKAARIARAEDAIDITVEYNRVLNITQPKLERSRLYKDGNYREGIWSLIRGAASSAEAQSQTEQRSEGGSRSSNSEGSSDSSDSSDSSGA